MARTHSEAQHSDATKLHAFYERATLIRHHPLFDSAQASTIHPNMPERTSIHDVEAAPDIDHSMDNIDWKLFTGNQWIDLASLVRPLVFSETDKIRWSLMLPIISQTAPSLKESADLVHANYKLWVKTLYFGAQELGNATEEDENTVRLASELDIDMSDVASDYSMAIKVFNGEIFHVNLDYWTWLRQYPDGIVHSMYLKAAQFRTVSSCIHIENVRQLIMAGWQAQVLPRLALFNPPPAPGQLNFESDNEPDDEARRREEEDAELGRQMGV